MKRRPFTKQDLISTINRFKACRVTEKHNLMNTINLTKNKRPVYTSHANHGINDLRIMNDGMAKTQTFGTVLAESKQERRLLNHEKHCKIWDKRSQILSKK